MDTLNVQELTYQKPNHHSSNTTSPSNWGDLGNLANFSYMFEFGKSFLLNTKTDGATWTLSWIIGGLLEQNNGSIKKNGFLYPKLERRKHTWCVRHEPTPKNLLWEKSVATQIRDGLKTVNGQYIQNEQELFERFHLSPDRYNRSLNQLSSEAWRASCAIGLAYGKNIYCFPYISPEYLDQYTWFQETIKLLTETGSLVLFPGKIKKSTESWFDEVITI